MGGKHKPVPGCSFNSGTSFMWSHSVLFISAYDEYEVSPYEELKLNLVRNIEVSRMASIMAGRVNFGGLERKVKKKAIPFISH